MTTGDNRRIVGIGKESAVHHFLNDRRTRSLCGALNDDRVFAGDIAETLALVDADQRGLTLCDHCADHAAP